MKLLRATARERIYGLRPSDLQMLLIVLGSFPREGRRPNLSQFGDSTEITEGQKLLDEALAAQRREMRRDLETWLQAGDRFRQTEGHLEWRIENDRREWLLQILNDVRVGAWNELGSPDDLEGAHRQVGENSMRPLMLMDMAGMFQMDLLQEPGGDATE